MREAFQAVVRKIIGAEPGHEPCVDREYDVTERTCNRAFLALLTGEENATEAATAYLRRTAASEGAAGPAGLYLRLLEAAGREIETACRENDDFTRRLRVLADFLAAGGGAPGETETLERCWAVFFPEAAGAMTEREARIAALRDKRKVRIERLSPDPVSDPGRRLLFTANALLTVPGDPAALDGLEMSDTLREKIMAVCSEPQQHWYDHPVPLDASPAENEILYGLRGLAEAVMFERARGTAGTDRKAPCVLSVSVTHAGIQAFAGDYIREVIRGAGGLDAIEPYVFTEADTGRVVDEVLAPAAARYRGDRAGGDLRRIFGVDGSYGRHYSFLKAVAAFWHVLIDADIAATFKIDLDQVFPQEVLVAETGRSAFEHLASPLWGAAAVDVDGRPVELGMIAGALVNERDIDRSLFTPDVVFPAGSFSAAEHFFCSRMAGALSTAGELMTRYDGDLDGETACIQRIHVTGGTNGIRVDALRAHRPFTPAFIGRAEDQAYILSVFGRDGRRLAYAHEDGLIMRHDKAAFAKRAMENAKIGRTIGEYLRMLYFSAYARVLTGGDPSAVKRLIDPFTGCFVSRIPVTIVALRFALTARRLFAAGENEDAVRLVREGARRIAQALDFTAGEKSALEQQYRAERALWDTYYDTLDALEAALAEDDQFARELRRKAREIAAGCRL